MCHFIIYCLICARAEPGRGMPRQGRGPRLSSSTDRRPPSPYPLRPPAPRAFSCPASGFGGCDHRCTNLLVVGSERKLRQLREGSRPLGSGFGVVWFQDGWRAPPSPCPPSPLAPCAFASPDKKDVLQFRNITETGSYLKAGQAEDMVECTL